MAVAETPETDGTPAGGTGPPPTVAELILARADDENPALLHDDETWTYAGYVEECSQRAAWLLAHRPDGPFHVGILLENVPEFPMWLGAIALAGAVAVGINPTRRGAELARDVAHTDCALVVTDEALLPLLDGLDIGIGPGSLLVVDTPEYHDACSAPRRPAPPHRRLPRRPLRPDLHSPTSAPPRPCSARRAARQHRHRRRIDDGLGPAASPTRRCPLHSNT